MKTSLRLLLAAAFAISLSTSALAQLKEREMTRITQGKITRNEAQHLVTQQYPGAKIRSCELRGPKNHRVWQVEFVNAGAARPMRVEVDGRTGKVAAAGQSANKGH